MEAQRLRPGIPGDSQLNLSGAGDAVGEAFNHSNAECRPAFRLESRVRGRRDGGPQVPQSGPIREKEQSSMSTIQLQFDRQGDRAGVKES